MDSDTSTVSRTLGSKAAAQQMKKQADRRADRARGAAEVKTESKDRRWNKDEKA